MSNSEHSQPEDSTLTVMEALIQVTQQVLSAPYEFGVDGIAELIQERDRLLKLLSSHSLEQLSEDELSVLKLKMKHLEAIEPEVHARIQIVRDAIAAQIKEVVAGKKVAQQYRLEIESHFTQQFDV